LSATEFQNPNQITTEGDEPGTPDEKFQKIHNDQAQADGHTKQIRDDSMR
jgi:hypothetical protein